MERKPFEKKLKCLQSGASHMGDPTDWWFYACEAGAALPAESNLDITESLKLEWATLCPNDHLDEMNSP